ncbi:MAG: GGDEF domain-containing protein [Gammaproteobacteria bacterium]|nr:MAG: GGDEF domain-containing protein [Gammaproteobacteria bacterium]
MGPWPPFPLASFPPGAPRSPQEPPGVTKLLQGVGLGIHQLASGSLRMRLLWLLVRDDGCMTHMRYPQMRRLRRTFAMAAAIAVYSLFCWGSVQFRVLEQTQAGAVLVAAVGLTGLILMGGSFAADIGRRVDTSILGVAQGVWANLALIATALLVTDVMRVMLLVTTLLSLQFFALHLRRQQVLWIASAGWITYSLVLAWRLNTGAVHDPRYEFLIWIGYTLALGAAVLISGEVAQLRTALTRRTRELEDTLERLHELAMRDDLTGLYNRRQLMEYLVRQKALADRDALGFTLCFVDLDHFKRVNDKFGHTRGDEVLKEFAEIAMKVVREEDFVARIGGEEFVMVLINASLNDAEMVANRLRQQTQVMAIDPSDLGFSVTASVGIAMYGGGEEIEQLLDRADAAMYAAKNQGRNRVIVATESETPGIPRATRHDLAS